MALSILNNICAIKSMIVLQVKCPQLSKPEATAARNENSMLHVVHATYVEYFKSVT